jgi:hypothetical protein
LTEEIYVYALAKTSAQYVRFGSNDFKAPGGVQKTKYFKFAPFLDGTHMESHERNAESGWNQLTLYRKRPWVALPGPSGQLLRKDIS